jgi:hypothetical protein
MYLINNNSALMSGYISCVSKCCISVLTYFIGVLLLVCFNSFMSNVDIETVPPWTNVDIWSQSSFRVSLICRSYVTTRNCILYHCNHECLVCILLPSGSRGMNDIYILLCISVSNMASCSGTRVPSGMKKLKYNAVCIENEDSVIALLNE